MNVLVLGGNGFIGSHVVDALLDGGHGVVVYDRRPEQFRPPHPDVKYIVGDFSDKSAILEALQGVSAVLHLVSTTVPLTSNMDPISDISHNLISSVELLLMMRGCNVRKLVFLSSGGTVYGVPQRIPVDEKHPLHPICSYGVVKSAIEKYVAMENYLHGLEYTILRVSNPYGPRQGHVGVQGLINTLLWSAYRGDPIPVWGDGTTSRDYVYVHDIARACASALAYSGIGTFNAGSGEGLTVNEIIELVRIITGKKLITQRLPARSFDVPRIVLDCAAARATLGWRAETSISTGIQKTWDWIISQEAPNATA